jgi:L-lactate dehydrogenase (cytochrome)
MRPFTCIPDLREMAKRRVPRAFFEYADSGSYNEETLRANRADLEAVKLRQRILIDVDRRDLSTTIVGQKVSLPIALAPIGLLGMQHGDGEILAARAANAAGVPFTLSTMSVCSIEQVAEATGKPFWFQVYVIRDRAFIEALIARAKAANCSALVLTLDLQILGQRHRDVKNGLTVPPEIRLSNIIDIATKPRWLRSILNSRSKTFGNLAGHVKGMENVNSLAEWTASQFDPTLSWKDVAWIRKLWPGKLILKGIMDVEDAKLAAKSGADAIVVSNHGGRQLDGAASSISMLPLIADAVGNEIEIMFDGGIRSGQDIMRALALGAKSCMIGRAFVYGLGADGEAGVAKAIDILRKELDVTMALCGVSKVTDIGPHVLVGGESTVTATARKATPRARAKPDSKAEKPAAKPAAKSAKAAKAETSDAKTDS